jgi:hypothetical protein
MDDLKSVVAVCGNEARIYGERDEKTNVRPLKKIVRFDNYGQALFFAQDYEDKGRHKKK